MSVFVVLVMCLMYVSVLQSFEAFIHQRLICFLYYINLGLSKEFTYILHFNTQSRAGKFEL